MSRHASSQQDTSREEINGIVRTLKSLPALPAVAVKILEIITNEDPDLDELASLIETDQATAIKILKLINSPHFGVPTQITSIRKAVLMLGFSEVRGVLLGVTVTESLIKSLRETRGKEQDILWKHSLSCAICAEMLTAKICPGLKAEAFVGGLLHDVGKLILESCFPDKLDQVRSEHTGQGVPWLTAEQEILGVDHATVGKWLAENWNLPELFVQAIWLHHHPLSAIVDLEFVKKKELVLTIHLADILAHDIMVDSMVSRHTAIDYADILDFLKIDSQDIENLSTSLGKHFSERASMLDFEENEPSFYYHALQRANRKLAEFATTNGRYGILKKANDRLSHLHDLHTELSRVQSAKEVLNKVAKTMASKFCKQEGIVYYLEQTDKRLIGSCWCPGTAPRTISVEVDEKGRPKHGIPALGFGLNDLIQSSHKRFSGIPSRNHLDRLVQYHRPYLVIPLGIGYRTAGEIGFVETNETNGEKLTTDDLKIYGHLSSITETALSRVALTEGMRGTTESLSEALLKNSRMMMMLKKSSAEKQRMEQEILKAQKLDSLGVLAGGIAHDFNNILTAIAGNLSLAKIYTKPGEKVFDKLVQAEKAFLRAKDLTQQLLTFSKKGGPSIRKATSLSKLIRDSIGFALRGSNVRGECHLPDDLLPVLVDEGQINQALNNLLINADQAMPDGGTISVKAGNVTIGMENRLPLKGGRYVKTSIRDEGIGIPNEDLTKIFDPYFTTKEKGNGLGLATTYSIIKNHEGHISVESQSGVGTTFHIYLSCSEKRDLTPEDDEEKPIAGKGRILIMDDEEEIRRLTGEMLVSIGYEVQVARDGLEAIESFKASRDSGRPFDVIIVDLTVPGSMGGRETLRRMREIDGSVKAVVSSGYANDPVIVDSGEYGFNDVIVKPYRITELSRVLHRTITQTV